LSKTSIAEREYVAYWLAGGEAKATCSTLRTPSCIIALHVAITITVTCKSSRPMSTDYYFSHQRTTRIYRHILGVCLKLRFFRSSRDVSTDSLIAVSQPTHSAHHTKHVVVGGIHAHLGGGAHAHGVVGHRQQQGRVINAGQIACAAGLVLLRGQGKGVHVDAHGRHVGVVLVGLHLVEVATLAHREPVVAVQLQKSRHYGVHATHALHAGHGVARLQAGAVPPIGVVERLLALPRVDHSVVAGHEGIALHHPDQLLARVVEVQLQLVGGAVDGLSTSVLQGLNQVLVAHLGELAALVRVQVDVVHVQGGCHQVRGVHTVANGVQVGARRVIGGVVPHQVLQVVELQVDAHLVVLEGDQGQGQTRVAVEPELEGHVQGVLGCAAQQGGRAQGLTASAVVVARVAALHHQVGQLGHIANHLGIAGLLACLLSKLIPDLQPVTIVLVDALATNLQLNPVDKIVTHPVEPTELSTRAVRGVNGHRGQGCLQVDAVDQISVALDCAGHLVTKTRVAVEGVLNRLHGKVGVTAIYQLEEGNLRITGQINVLSAIGYKLHKATSRHFVIPQYKKKN
jgi:hypothetical protein